MTTMDWRLKLPSLDGQSVTLRALRRSDAPSLFGLLATEEVTRFTPAAPASVEAFERFIEWTDAERSRGRFACFAITVHGLDTAIGLFQIRITELDSGTAEWGFAIGSPFWGAGIFPEAAELVMSFAFDEMKLNRLEARTVVQNGRGIGALQKIGAVGEGLLRKSFRRGSQYMDQFLFAIVREDRSSAPEAVESLHSTIH